MKPTSATPSSRSPRPLRCFDRSLAVGEHDEIALEPDPGDEGTAELLFRAERDCFVGASLTVEPEYRWNVNGRAVSARAAPS